MKKLFVAVFWLLAGLSIGVAQSETTIRQGGAIYDVSTGSFLGYINLNTGKEETLATTLGSGLTATAVVCTSSTKALTSTCSSATPSFAATTVTALTATTVTAGGAITANYIGSFQGTGGNVTGTVQNVVDVTQDHTTYRGLAFGYDSSGQIGVIAAQTASAASSIAFYNYTGGAWVNTVRFDSGLNTSKVPLFVSTGSAANQLRMAQTTVPTCTSNCGTSPSVAGTDTAGVVTMGASGVPASAWVVTFNGTWAAAPSCNVQSALATMVVGKMPIAVVTTTTTMTVTTNGTAPSTSDKYQFICVGVS